MVFALLLYGDMVTEDEYNKRLNKLFLDHIEDQDLLYLEWETDVKKAITYISAHIDYNVFDYEQFGRNLMDRLSVYYRNCSDIKRFADRAYGLWEVLPEVMQDREPFFTLCYADDPLSWGEEEQTRNIYEKMLNYYKD